MINGWPRAAFRPDPQIVPGPERFLGRQRHGGAPRGGVPVLRGTPHASQAWRRALRARQLRQYASRRSAGPLISGPGDQADATRMQRKARTRTQDCGAGTKKRTLFDIVNENDASGPLGSGARRAITSAATRSGHGRGRAFLRHQGKVPARMRKRRDTAVTTDRRRRRCRASSTRARGQPTAVHVPSGLRQALPRATCGLPSI